MSVLGRLPRRETGPIPHGKYFVSHSYKDELVRDKLIEQLPHGVRPFIFPPIKTTPQEFVSNALIEAILDSDGMIYLNEGHSAKSFWVAFERDYAVRSKKRVFSYTPSIDKLTFHQAPPMDLAIFPMCSYKDNQTCTPIFDFMIERNFDLWVSHSPSSDWLKEVGDGLKDIIDRGGYAVGFWSTASPQWVEDETKKLLNAERVVVASVAEDEPAFMRDHQQFLVKLYDENSLNNNRIDDLIVRLYWLIFRNQFPELVYE